MFQILAVTRSHLKTFYFYLLEDFTKSFFSVNQILLVTKSHFQI